ncbi:uncharacterized protein LTR77_008891 [Saxophila tyrrhenica]|uniref:Uncharacterized protein n=1 Tax=Saxophila tyrrhenica TaxID=1690608 RepID=A0AAV9P340_9PEZI|nr:hypothetical protein LTR77_008891 [Saxophila tyrrhenica]
MEIRSTPILEISVNDTAQPSRIFTPDSSTMGLPCSCMSTGYLTSTRVQSIQNNYQLATLLITVTDATRRLLLNVDSMAKPTSPGSTSNVMEPQAMLLPAISGHQKRLYVRRMLRVEVLGSPIDEHNGTLFGIIRSWESRQDKWHQSPEFYEEQVKMYGHQDTVNRDTNKHCRNCYRLIQQVKQAVCRIDV